MDILGDRVSRGGHRAQPRSWQANALALAAAATGDGRVTWVSWIMNAFRTISTGRKPAG